MGKPLGYFSLDNEAPLIDEIAEFFGQDLSGMRRDEKLWLIGRLAHECWAGSDSDEAPRDEVTEIIDRINEIEDWHAIALIKCLLQDL